MQALSVVAPSVVAPRGQRILSGKKTLEIRNWIPDKWFPIKNLLIVENGKFLTDDYRQDQDGVLVAVVDVLSAHMWQPEELEAAMTDKWLGGYWAWQLSNVRKITDHIIVPAERKIYDLKLLGIERIINEAVPIFADSKAPPHSTQ